MHNHIQTLHLVFLIVDTQTMQEIHSDCFQRASLDSCKVQIMFYSLPYLLLAILLPRKDNTDY